LQVVVVEDLAVEERQVQVVQVVYFRVKHLLPKEQHLM
jgi:hypothetical protein